MSQILRERPNPATLFPPLQGTQAAQRPIRIIPDCAQMAQLSTLFSAVSLIRQYCSLPSKERRLRNALSELSRIARKWRSFRHYLAPSA
ncbi:hypothetical protein M8J76_016386 [Diaphorina citri]|nr:hypothetical protein M8J76_016386 [Diaphorina citri]